MTKGRAWDSFSRLSGFFAHARQTSMDDNVSMTMEAEVVSDVCFLCGGRDDLHVVDCQSEHDGKLICSACRRQGIYLQEDL